MKLTVASAALTLALSGAAFAQAGNPGAHFVQNWDQDGDGAVTAAEAQTMRDNLFTTFDADEDGKLSPEEFDAFDAVRAADQEQVRAEMGVKAGGGMGQGMGPGMMRAEGGLMRSFNDANGDGAVSREEFVGRSAEWFAVMDRDGDEKITVGDFER
jgi:EF hand